MAVLSQIVAPVVISIGTGVFFDHLAVKRYRAMARVGAEIKVKAGVELLKKTTDSAEKAAAISRIISGFEEVDISSRNWSIWEEKTSFSTRPSTSSSNNLEKMVDKERELFEYVDSEVKSDNTLDKQINAYYNCKNWREEYKKHL